MIFTENKNLDFVLEKQREFFKTGKTFSPEFRIGMLKKLYSAIEKNEAEISKALEKDLGKSEFESYMCEIGLSKSEISYMIKNVKKFSKRKGVKTPLSLYFGKSYTVPVPYGNVLIMSPWNYPFLLTIEPLVDAISAGNTAIVKPSAYSPETSAIIKKIVEEIFPEEFVAVVTGGRKENSELLEKKFDFIFFTGSSGVGKTVLHSAAEHLTPVVLELGGKSPCVIDSSAKIKLAARRVVFGKYLNCGQTCVAPDYILCHKSVKDEFIAEVKKQVKEQLGENPLGNPQYGKIVNKKHFDRLLGLIDPGKTVLGGGYDEEKLKIEPTVMDNVSWEDAVMQEEIFGPVMPILTFDDFDEVLSVLKEKQKPLACYIFSENRAHIDEITKKTVYGGGCVNEVVTHLATSEMAFGGVGESGMGAYHGKTGFETFSHRKSVLQKSSLIDLPVQYRPYNGKNRKLLDLLLK